MPLSECKRTPGLRLDLICILAYISKKECICLFIVASEASDQYEMPFIFHTHTQWSSFKLNGVGGDGGGAGIWSANYRQTKIPINMKFGMQVHFSAIYEFSSKFPYLSYFWPYGQKYILMHFNFYIQTKMARIMNYTTFYINFGLVNLIKILFK